MSDYGTATVDGVTYDLLEEIGEWDYSWHMGYLMRDPSGALFFGATGGCSCNDFAENISANGMTPVKSWHEAVEVAKEEFSEADVATFAERLMNSRH